MKRNFIPYLLISALVVLSTVSCNKNEKITMNNNSDEVSNTYKMENEREELGEYFYTVDSDLDELSDEFDDENTLKNWINMSEAEGWPNRIEEANINQNSKGRFYIIPSSGAWYHNYHGAYYYKEVEGDFLVTTKMEVTGRDSEIPSDDWTLSGLMIRKPIDYNAVTNKEDVKENWMYIMEGTSSYGTRLIDQKQTKDGRHSYSTEPSKNGRVELAFARIGSLFVGAYRHEGDKDWSIFNHFIREDMPEVVQVGLGLTCDYNFSRSIPSSSYNTEIHNTTPRDNVSYFDYVRFRRLEAPDELLSKVNNGQFSDITKEDFLQLFTRQ